MIGKLQKRLPVVTDNPVDLSNRILATGETDEATNRVIQKCWPVTDDIAVVESFSHIIGFRTDEGVVCFDASGSHTGAAAVEALRGWTEDRVHSLVYTHGHVDHVGGSGAFAADAATRGDAAASVVAHEAVAPRMERYRYTNGWNTAINRRQFGGISKKSGMDIGGDADFLPADTLWPTTTFDAELTLNVGGMDFELHHDRGETDDHAWAWIPQHRALCVGDFVTWVFPNCGNPQKVQRFPKEWAAALRKMQAKNAHWLFGAHGLPVQGEANVTRVLGDLATALETLVVNTVEMMNAGESLDTILHAQRDAIPEDHLLRPWMQPVYDEPEFVVRNIWRLYGGWWDQNAAHLKPSPDGILGAEIAALAGGVETLIARAQELATAGDYRLACHLIEFARGADPESATVHGARAEIYQARRNNEFSLMSKGVFSAAANDSKAILER